MARLDVWMSASATPSALISEISALTDLALAVIASRASLPVVVTPSVTRAKSGFAVTLPSPVTSTRRSLLISTSRVCARAGETAESAVTEAMNARLRNVIGLSLPRQYPFHVPTAQSAILAFRLWLYPFAIAKVAMACAAHDGLRPGQPNVRAIAFADRAVTVAGQNVADRAQAHRAIGLGVAAARHVEVEDAGRVGDDLDRQRVVLRP